MNTLENRSFELKRLIDSLTNQIYTKITNDLLDDIDVLLSRRHAFLNELVTIAATEEDKKDILDYINGIRDRDDSIKQMLVEDRDKVKTALTQLSQLKAYVD